MRSLDNRHDLSWPHGRGWQGGRLAKGRRPGFLIGEIAGLARSMLSAGSKGSGARTMVYPSEPGNSRPGSRARHTLDTPSWLSARPTGGQFFIAFPWVNLSNDAFGGAGPEIDGNPRSGSC